jgi:hypothetical protein
MRKERRPLDGCQLLVDRVVTEVNYLESDLLA